MNNPSFTSTPSPAQERCRPFSQGGKVLPINVIESWSLCHHLACVVVYLHRAALSGLGSQTATEGSLKDLRQAEWYLEREFFRKRSCWNFSGNCQTASAGSGVLSPEAVSREWQLPPLLREAMFSIYTFQKLLYALPGTRIICLKQALSCLRAEIRRQAYFREACSVELASTRFASARFAPAKLVLRESGGAGEGGSSEGTRGMTS